MPVKKALGIDVGGTGIKAAIVDIGTGELVTERARFRTPDPATPAAVVQVIQQAIGRLDYRGPAGCGFPGVVRQGVIHTAANVSKRWIGVDAASLLKEETGLEFTLGNDADLAGLAEMRFGAGRDRKGLVILLTFGTGIGSAFFLDGKLVPNVELGHLEIDGREAETWASERARIREGLSYKAWTKRVNVVLARVHAYFWPELILFGGGVSKKFDEFGHRLKAPCEILPATLRNRAGVIGAALAAATRRF
jgi:polyphosphate glucokinase